MLEIVFDGPPSHSSGRFVEVEDGSGHSVRAGQWIERGNGLWVLRLTDADMLAALAPAEGGELKLETTEPMRNALFGERDDNDILAMLGRDFDRQSARIRHPSEPNR